MLVVVGILAALSVTVGSALFTSQATVSDNSFTTGTLNIAASPATTLFNVAGMVPGDAQYAPLTITNDGTLALRYAMTSTATDDANHLAAALDIEIRKVAATCDATTFAAATDVAMAPTKLSTASFGDAATGSQTGDRALVASANEVLCVKVALPTTYTQQTATTTATFTFAAEQTANN